MHLTILLFLFTALETDTFTPFPSGVSMVNDKGLTSVYCSSDEGFLSAAPGAPLLPIVSRVFALPGKCTISDANVVLQFTDPPVSSNIPVIAAEAVQSTGAAMFSETLPAREAVTGDESLVSIRRGTILNAFTIITVSVNPWRYSPESGDLSLASSCTLEFEWQGQTSPVFLSDIQAETVNYRLSQIADRYSIPEIPAVTGSDSDIDYLIITGDDYTDLLQPLTDLLESRSYSWETLSVQSISGSWSGRDVQEDIRNCIRYHALNSGTAFVLLAGDEDVVPARQVYMECEGLVEYAPCDLYYSDIDGSWDVNGNGIYGEDEDSLDLYADVILGRLLFSTPDGAAAIFSKNLEYSEAGEADWYKRAVLCGAQLFPETGYSGEKGCELMAEEFPSSFAITSAYEIEVGDHPDTYFPVLYSGAGWNHYAGHGTVKGVWWGDFAGIMTIQRTNGFDNPGQYGIHSSIGCHTGDFTDAEAADGCLADTLLTLPGGGGIACFFNTTWGWEGYWPEIGSSERLCLNTVEQVYRQKASTLGLAYTVAKDLEIPLITGPYDRVLQSVLAYSAFMEPSLEVLGVGSHNPVPPLPFRIVITGPNPVSSDAVGFRVTGASPSYEVSVFDITGRKVLTTISLQQNTLYSLDISSLYPGVYFISAVSPGGSMVTESFVRLR